MSKTQSETDRQYIAAVEQGDSTQIRKLIRRKITPPKRLMLYCLLRKHPELLQLLAEAGADPNDVDGFHNTALGHAVTDYPPEIVKALLNLGADPNQESTHLLPLVYVAYDEDIECVQELLGHGADPNHPQWNGVIPLHAAVRHGQPLVTKLLLEAGGDPRIAGPDGKTSIDIARASNDADLVELLNSYVGKTSLRRTKPKKKKSKSKR